MKRLALSLCFLLLLVACGGESAPEPEPNKAPKAAFTFTQTDLMVSVDASTSTDSDGSIASYTWDFGDETETVTGSTAEHSYARAGGFSISLTVKDDDGAEASTMETVTLVDPEGSISGRISLGSTTFGANAVVLSPKKHSVPVIQEASPLVEVANRPTLITGDVLVRFKETNGIETQALSLQVQGMQFERVRSLGQKHSALYRAGGLSEAETLSLVDAFAARPDVLHASANYWHYPSSIPNDPAYAFQWHYPAINMPQAWDLTKGSVDVVVAVIDTGVVAHPELDLLPGYDFVSDLTNAADGDGPDDDATDTGPDQATGYHGTHVAGTIGAKTDDDTGIASVAWTVKILPVRVLGVQGGSTADIDDGILWAAGLHETIPNPNPADVLNLSLGGTGICSSVAQETYDKVIAAGKIVVVAAGNSNENAGFVTPANCNNVITVGATDFATNRAFYSNFGDSVDVMAPGGDTTVNLNKDKYFDGVLSLGFDEDSSKFISKFNQGTSMATPHVAGVAALMKSLDADITQAEVRTALTSTARPLTATACTADTQSGLQASDCGAGLIDAFAALESLSATEPQAPSKTYAFSPPSLDFGTSRTEALSFTISNDSSSEITWSIGEQFIEDVDNPSEVKGSIVIDTPNFMASGTVQAGSSETFAIAIDGSSVTVNGTYRLDVPFSINDESENYPLYFTKGIDSSPTTAGNLEAMNVYICTTDQDQDACLTEANSSVVTGSGLSVDYTTKKVVRDQSYIVAAWKDNDASGSVNPGDYYGFYSVDSLGATEVSPPKVDVDFTVEEQEETE